MNLEKVRRLYVVYNRLNKTGLLSEKQEVVFNVINSLEVIGSSEDPNEIKNTVNNNLIDCFSKLEANPYVSLLKYANKKFNNQEKTSNDEPDYVYQFVESFDKLLSKDDLFKNYLNKYIQDNNLQKDLELYDDSEEQNTIEERSKSMSKTLKVLFWVFIAPFLTFFICSMLITLIDLGEDGNTFNQTNTIFNIVSFTINILIFILLHCFVLNKFKRTITKIIMYTITILILLFFGIFIRVEGAVVAFFINPILAILLTRKNRVEKITKKLATAKINKEKELNKNTSANDLKNIKQKEKRIPVFKTTKAYYWPSILGFVSLPICIMFIFVCFIVDFDISNNVTRTIFTILASILSIVVLITYTPMLYKILIARININKIYPKEIAFYNSENKTLEIKTPNENVLLNISDINFVLAIKFVNHSYKISDIEVDRDTVSAIQINTKDGKTYNLYFVKKPKLQAEILSNIISEI